MRACQFRHFGSEASRRSNVRTVEGRTAAGTAPRLLSLLRDLRVKPFGFAQGRLVRQERSPKSASDCDGFPVISLIIPWWRGNSQCLCESPRKNFLAGIYSLQNSLRRELHGVCPYDSGTIAGLVGAVPSTGNTLNSNFHRTLGNLRISYLEASASAVIGTLDTPAGNLPTRLPVPTMPTYLARLPGCTG